MLLILYNHITSHNCGYLNSSAVSIESVAQSVLNGFRSFWGHVSHFETDFYLSEKKWTTKNFTSFVVFFSKVSSSTKNAQISHHRSWPYKKLFYRKLLLIFVSKIVLKLCWLLPQSQEVLLTRIEQNTLKNHIQCLPKKGIQFTSQHCSVMTRFSKP